MQDVKERRALVRLALHGCPVLEQGQIDWEGTPRSFTVSLIEALDRYGKWNGELTVVMLLNECRENIGIDGQQQIDEFIKELTPQPTLPPMPIVTERPIIKPLNHIEAPKTDTLMLEEMTKRTLVVLPSPFAWREVPAETQLNTSAFFIAKYPITNAQFAIFERANDGYRNVKWWNYSRAAKEWRTSTKEEKSYSPDAEYPRTNLCWFEAIAFCGWLSSRVGFKVRLPTETEWQYAAQGNDGRKYPWDNDFDPNRCNAGDKNGGTTPVTQYDLPLPDKRSGLSPFGVADMAGNVSEWCLDATSNEHIERAIQEKGSILCGGSYYDNQVVACVTQRITSHPAHSRGKRFGFRILHPLSP